MAIADDTTDPSPQLAALRALFAAVAASAGLPGTAVAFNPPPPIASPCAAGSWSSTGRTPCQLASVGHYVSTSGATSQTPAPLGGYVDTAGATAPKLAPLGSYVDTVGATAAKLAPAGFYVDKTGQAAPLPAPAGRFAAGVGNVAAQACPTGSNAYGAASACRIVQAGFQGAGVTPLLGGTLGGGGVHDLGAVQPGDSFSFRVVNTSTDMATMANLTALTLLSYALSDDRLFELAGFSEGMELQAGGGWAALALRAKASLPAGAFTFTLTLVTDQYADYRTAGKQFSYTFTGLSAAPVPEPAALALWLAGLVVLGAAARRRGAWARR